MVVLFILLWFVVGAPLAVLSEVVKAESPRIVRAGRIGFALLLSGQLLLAAVFFTLGNANPNPVLNATRAIWWVTVVLAGIPLTFISGLALRRAYSGRRLVLAVAALVTAVLYLAFPFGFIPAHHALTGLGRFEHDNHALDIVVLLVPCLILLANELRWKPEPEPDFG